MSEPVPQIDHFKALGHEMRREIMLYLLREKKAPFTQIMHFLDLDPLWQCGTIGYHLNVLVSTGVLGKHADGYFLTNKGRALADTIAKVRDLEGEKMKNSGEPEGVLENLNARSVCWLLAVAKGIKPAATILSVAKENWAGFLGVLAELGLCWSYKGIDGMVLTCQRKEAERLFGDLSTSSNEELVGLLLDEKNWTDLLSGEEPSFKTLDPSSTRLTPIIYENPNAAWEVIVSKDIRSLSSFARFNQRTENSACFRNHFERGRALGYPDCCIKAFEEGGRLGLVARHKFFKELIDLGLDENMPVEFWAIAHVPCSAGCKESLRLGRKYLDAVKLYSSALHNHVLERLRVSYLSYSVGERFLGLKEVAKHQYLEELRKEYDRI